MSHQLLALERKEAKATRKFEVVSSKFETVLQTRAMTPQEEVELGVVSAKLARVRSALKAEQRRVADAAASIASRDAALGAAAGVGGSNFGGAVINNAIENLTYGPGNPANSFYRDLLNASVYGPATKAAQKRLEAHQAEMEAIQKRSSVGSKEGAAVRSYFRNASRKEERSGYEQRDTITNGGPGLSSPGSPNDMAPFAPPVFFLPEYAEYRTYGRTFLNILAKHPMPESGMAFFVPKITTPTEAVVQTSENGSVSTQDLASEYVSGTLSTLVSNLQVSQQYLDRVGPGIAGDQIVQRDQTNQLNRALNINAYTALLQNSSVGTVQYSDATGSQATFNGQAVADYRQTLAKAAIVIQTTDGTVAYPTAVVTDVNVAESILAAYDSTYRPFVVPQGVAFNPIATGDYVNGPEGYTGFSFGGLPLYKDQGLYTSAAADNFAGAGASGSGSAAFDADSDNHLAVVGAWDIAAVWLESQPVYRVLPQPGAATLTVLIQQYTYYALVVPYPTAVQVVSSKGTTSSTLTTVL